MRVYSSDAIMLVDIDSVKKEREQVPILGKKFGKLTPYEKVYGRYKKDNKTVIMYKCHCDCGNDIVVPKPYLKRNKNPNCGCEGYSIGKLKGRSSYIGKRYGKLLVLKTALKNGNSYWCRCDCGNEVRVKRETLKRGIIKDCGCGNVDRRKIGYIYYGKWELLCKDTLNKDKSVPRWLCRCVKCDRVQSLTSAELTFNNVAKCRGCRKDDVKSAIKSRLHNIWVGMKNRCKGTGGQNTIRYYAGRGIRYQPSWEKFENFYDDMKEGYVDNLQLDRIDHNGDYTKENCRWVTAKENCRNRRDNSFVTAGGETHVQAWWREKYGVCNTDSLKRCLRRDYGNDWEIKKGHRQNWLDTPRYHV
jgi:hypothetical protein